MVTLKSDVNETGIREYYLVGLDNWEDYSVVLSYLEDLDDVTVLTKINGLFSRIATLEKGGMTFKLIFHEDVGLYSHVVGSPSPRMDIILETVLEKVVSEINMTK